MVKLHEDEGCIWVMDKVKLTKKGVVEGYGSAAERAKIVYSFNCLFLLPSDLATRLEKFKQQLDKNLISKEDYEKRERKSSLKSKRVR